jgi:hypothetical protein
VREIDRFLNGVGVDKSPRPVDLVLGPGGSEDRFPGRLAEKERGDWIDFRHYTWWRSLRLSEELDVGLTKLVAGLYDIPEAQLPVLRREERRRRNRLLIGLLSFVVTVALVIAGLAFYAWRQKSLAETQRRLALGRQLQAELSEKRTAVERNFARAERNKFRAAQITKQIKRPIRNNMQRRSLNVLPNSNHKQRNFGRKRSNSRKNSGILHRILSLRQSLICSQVAFLAWKWWHREQVILCTMAMRKPHGLWSSRGGPGKPTNKDCARLSWNSEINGRQVAIAKKVSVIEEGKPHVIDLLDKIGFWRAACHKDGFHSLKSDSERKSFAKNVAVHL